MQGHSAADTSGTVLTFRNPNKKNGWLATLVYYIFILLALSLLLTFADQIINWTLQSTRKHIWHSTVQCSAIDTGSNTSGVLGKKLCLNGFGERPKKCLEFRAFVSPWNDEIDVTKIKVYDIFRPHLFEWVDSGKTHPGLYVHWFQEHINNVPAAAEAAEMTQWLWTCFHVALRLVTDLAVLFVFWCFQLWCACTYVRTSYIRTYARYINYALIVLLAKKTFFHFLHLSDTLR